jgi:hypothetical protein
MSYSVVENVEAMVASGDLSACLNRLVYASSVDFKCLLSIAGKADGVLISEPKDGETASVATDGIVMVRVGNAVFNGDFLTAATSGWATQVTSGAGSDVVGRARTGAASGMLAAVHIAPFYRVNSVGN